MAADCCVLKFLRSLKEKYLMRFQSENTVSKFFLAWCKTGPWDNSVFMSSIIFSLFVVIEVLN